MEQIEEEFETNTGLLFHQDYYKKASEFYKNKNLNLASQFYDKCMESKQPLVIYYKEACSCYFGLQLYKQVIEIGQKGIELLQEYPNQYNSKQILNNFQILLYASFIVLGQKNQAEQIFEQFDAQTKEKFSENDVVSKLITDRIKSESIDERKQEAQLILEHFETMKNYKESDKTPNYLVPMSWFNKWKNYTYFNQISGESRKNDLDMEQEFDHPGSIDISELLLLPQKNMLLSTKYCYLNQRINPQKKEKIDFIVVSPVIADYFIQKYGGQVLQRNNIQVGKDIMLEIALKQINFITLPIITKNQDYANVPIFKIQASQNDTVANIKQSLLNSLTYLTLRNPEKIQENCIIWKLKPNVSYQQVLDNYLHREQNKLVTIQGKQLKNDETIESLGLIETDILIVEYKLEDSKIFQGEEELKKQNSLKKTQFEMKQTQIYQQCQNCEKEESEDHQLEIECSCHYVKYCNQECQRANSSKHAKIHEQAEADKKQITAIGNHFGFPLNGPMDDQPKLKKGLVGLQNLGNTCFMNSSIQCLSNCFELTKYFLDGRFRDDMNPGNPLGNKCLLAGAYYELMNEIWQGKYSSTAPTNFKKVIASHVPQFSGYSQQDSQELLSYLLDGLNEDLNRVKVKPIIEQLESDGTNDKEIAEKSWKNYLKRNQSIITDLMVGQFKSTLVCPDCQRISITFDPFLSLSLPLKSPVKTIEMKFYLVYRNPQKQPQHVSIIVDQNGELDYLKDLLQKLDPSLDKKYLRCYYYNQLYRDTSVEKSSTCYKIDNHSNIMFVNQTFDPEYDDFSEKVSYPMLLELQIFSASVSSKPAGFSRIFYQNSEQTIQKFYLNTYKLIRHNIKNFFTYLKEDRQKEIPLEIDLEDNRDELIKQEFDLLCEKKMQPFKLNIIYEKKSRSLDYKENKKTLHQYYISAGQIMVVKLEFSSSFQPSKDISISSVMKLNKCQASDLNQKQDDVKKNKAETNSLYNSLDMFIKPEILQQGNEWYCNKCKEHKCAEKKMELQKLPYYLVLHLKRFKTGGVRNYGRIYYESGGEKISTFINYPVENLDLTSYVQSNETGEKYIYDLVGVSNHSGGMNYGHYTAYCKSPLDNQWYDYNDSSVTLQRGDIVSSSAYVLFYKRRQEK